MKVPAEEPAPIRRSVHVDCPIEDACRLFAERLPQWWPLKSHSMAPDQAQDCEIEPWVGGRVMERSRSGLERQWGTVVHWDPPRHLSFRSRDARQTVSVDFAVEAGGTRVTLTHTGWQWAAAPAGVPMAVAA